MISLERMRTFVRVAERGNFSAVARELGAGQSTVTRHLKELEEALGTRLFSRTTRRVNLTDEGSRYYTHCIQILRLVEQSSEDVRSTGAKSAGTIRVSCTAALGVLHITRLIFAFQEQYPDMRIDFRVTDERIDLVKDGVDIALRLGPLTDSSMKLHALGKCSRLLVAAPAYLSSKGRPSTPKDIKDHNMIRMTNVAESETLILHGPDQQRHAIPVKGDLLVDHGLVARQAVIDARGIAPAHQWLIDEMLADGSLEVLLPEYSLSSIPLNMLIVPERAGVARVRLLIDYLDAEIACLPGIGKTESR